MVTDDELRGVLRWIEDFWQRKGFAPTVREVVAGLGFSSTSTMAARIKALVKRGWLKGEAERSRTLKPTAIGRAEAGRDGMPCGVCGLTVQREDEATTVHKSCLVG